MILRTPQFRKSEQSADAPNALPPPPSAGSVSNVVCSTSGPTQSLLAPQSDLNFAGVPDRRHLVHHVQFPPVAHSRRTLSSTPHLLRHCQVRQLSALVPCRDRSLRPAVDRAPSQACKRRKLELARKALPHTYDMSL